MGKRYYCDYCDRSFVDEIQARKKHLNGTAHMRNKKIHYSTCRDMKTLIEDESGKEECFKFKNSGYCPFEDNCFRSHYPKQQLEAFKRQLEHEENAKKMNNLNELKTVQSWLEKRDTVNVSYDSTLESNLTPYMPLESNFYKSLPPSLRRLDITHFIDTEIPEWG